MTEKLPHLSYDEVMDLKVKNYYMPVEDFQKLTDQKRKEKALSHDPYYSSPKKNIGGKE